MASIVKRKSKYSVVYDYTDENGKRRQRWETFSTNAEAKKRKKQIEYEQDSGTFFIPTAKTLNDLLDEYMSIYGVNTWAMSTYESRRGLARNYITPIIGDMLLSDITPRMMDKYYRDLLSVKTVSVNNRKPTSEYLTPHTVREIHKLLRSAFNQAVRWELISRNPVLNATLPKEEHKERDIWTAETLSKAMEVCDDPILSLALNLAFSCSLRIGEMLGLTWDCIDIAPTRYGNKLSDSQHRDIENSKTRSGYEYSADQKVVYGLFSLKFHHTAGNNVAVRILSIRPPSVNHCVKHYQIKPDKHWSVSNNSKGKNELYNRPSYHYGDR